MKGGLQDYIEYRLMRAKETFSDARILADSDRWNSCVNRLYYACFYAVNALLIQRGFEAKTHNGIKTLFFREFILSQKMDKELGKLYSDLFDWRQEGDYTDFIRFDEQIVLPLIVKTEEFIHTIEKLLNAGD